MIISTLLKLADQLDKKGLATEANLLDDIIKQIAEKEYTYSIAYSYATPEDVEAGVSGENGWIVDKEKDTLPQIVNTAKNLTYNWDMDRSASGHGGFAGYAQSDDIDPGEKWSHKSYLLVVADLDETALQFLKEHLG